MKPRCGFTLIELMVVIAMVAILTSISTPNMMTRINNAKVSSASRQVLSSIQEARIHSIKVNSTTTIEFSEAGKTYEIRKWNPQANEFNIQTHSLPAGVQMTAAFGHGRILRYNGRGLPNSMGNVVLANNSGKTIKITVNINGSSSIPKNQKNI
jgi:prepilin-type N-terminal cleavage/methylation domain-containing protein